ncbi:MAG: hypothetical protein ACRDQ5_06395 [Sciscionella sp.]
MDYIGRAFEDFQELHGDRIGGDSAAVVGGLARIGGFPVMVIGHQKGRTIAELSGCNYGMPTPAGYRKAARLMRMAEKLGPARRHRHRHSRRLPRHLGRGAGSGGRRRGEYPSDGPARGTDRRGDHR